MFRLLTTPDVLLSIVADPTSKLLEDNSHVLYQLLSLFRKCCTRMELAHLPLPHKVTLYSCDLHEDAQYYKTILTTAANLRAAWFIGTTLAGVPAHPLDRITNGASHNDPIVLISHPAPNRQRKPHQRLNTKENTDTTISSHTTQLPPTRPKRALRNHLQTLKIFFPYQLVEELQTDTLITEQKTVLETDGTPTNEYGRPNWRFLHEVDGPAHHVT